MPVAIIGGRGTGKSVFVSLLATTAINYSNSTKGEKFGYYTEPAFTDAIGKIIASIKQRAWPAANLKGTLSEYSFDFGYSRLLAEPAEKITKGVTLGRRRLKPEMRYNIIRFNLYDIAGEDVEAIKNVAERAWSTKTVSVEDLPEDLRTVMDCNVLVFLIDASKITTDPTDRKKYDEMLTYDNVMADLMSLVTLYKSKRSPSVKVHPVFVLTKFDATDSKVLRAVGLPDEYSAWLDRLAKKRKGLLDVRQRERNEYTALFMAKFLGHTLALRQGARLRGVDLDRAVSFFSYLGTELSEDGFPIPRLISKDRVTYEIDYSESEYRAFIDYFGKIAGQIKDKTEGPPAFVTGLGR